MPLLTACIIIYNSSDTLTNHFLWWIHVQKQTMQSIHLCLDLYNITDLLCPATIIYMVE